MTVVVNSEGISIYLNEQIIQLSLEQSKNSYNSFLRDKALYGVQSVERRKYKGSQSAYYNKKSGGYYVMQNGHNFQKPEIEAARELAKHGYHVILQPESTEKGGVSLRLSGRGGETFPEGKIGTLWYEQYTSKSANTTAVKNSLKHAHSKGAEISLLYCPKETMMPNDVQRGIRMYNGQQFRQPRTVEKLICIFKNVRGRGLSITEYEVEK